MMAEVAALALGEPYPWWFNWATSPPPPLTIWVVIPQFPKNPAEDARLKKLFHGENYLTRDKRWVFAHPFIPAEMVHWHSPDWTEVVLKNRNTISIKSNEQTDLAFASNQVDLIVVDEPTEANKWGELISRMVAVPHARLIHGLTDAYDTTPYLDELIDNPDPSLDFEKFDFTTAGNPHNDLDHAASVFKFQSAEQRLVREAGLRPSEIARCYPYVERWIDRGSMAEIKNFQGGTGNWIRPFPIPKDWTRYVIHDPGSKIAATVWFAVEPGTENIFSYRAVLHRNPTGNLQYIVDVIHRANNGDEIYTWYIDPKAAHHTPNTYVRAANKPTIYFYQRASQKYGIRWVPGALELENYKRSSRINALSAYLDPQDKSMPMMYFFDVKDAIDPLKGLDGTPAMKYQFRKYRWDEKRERPIKGNDDSVYCCEAAAVIGLRSRTPNRTFRGWTNTLHDPVADFMDGKNGMPSDWKEEP